MLGYILERLKEKSTWVGIGSFITGLGVTISPDKWQIIMGIGMGLPGLISMFLPARVTESQVKPDAPK